MDRRRFWKWLLAFVPGAVAGRCLADWIIESKDHPKKVPVLPWKPVPPILPPLAKGWVREVTTCQISPDGLTLSVRVVDSCVFKEV